MESNLNQRVRMVLINTAIISVVSIVTYLLYSTIEKNKIISEKNQKIMIDSMTIVAKVRELNALKTAYEMLEMERDSFGLANDSLVAMVSTLNEYIAEVQDKNSEKSAASSLPQINTVIKKAEKALVREKKELTLIEKTNEVEVVKMMPVKTIGKSIQSTLDNVEMKVDHLEIEPIGKSGKILKLAQCTDDQVKHLRLKFVILQNKLASKSQKVFSIQLIEPDGSPYKFNPEYDYIKVEGQKVHLTNKRKVEFDGNDTQVSFFYPKCTPFKSGINTVQLFYDNKLMAEKTIDIK